MTRISAVLIVLMPALFAQQPARIEFEVASIKPDNPAISQGGRTHISNGSAGGIRDIINLTLRNLIMGAYDLRTDSQLVGGPGWLDSAGWDIVARYPAGSNEVQQSQMMQSLLADRFQLVVHRATRTLPVYSLVVAKNGPRLSPVTSQYSGMSAGPRMIRCDDVSMPEFASQLSSFLGTPVTDKTGLNGRYAIKLSFAPVQPDAAGDAADSGPSIFTALQEQAGLQLNSGKGPVEVLVIDKVEKPSAN